MQNVAKRAKTGEGGNGAKHAPSATSLGGGASGGMMTAVTNATVLAMCKELHMPDVNQEVAAFLAQTVEYHLREVLEDAIKVCRRLC
jgi:hypothetical protein